MKIHAAYLIAALAVCLWLAIALVRVENERYAMVVGLCQRDVVKPIQPCLDRVQTRTGWWWHLYYALID
jgi:hypothetical protein